VHAHELWSRTKFKTTKIFSCTFSFIHTKICTNENFLLYGIDSLLPEVVAIKPEVLYKTVNFQSQVVCVLTMPTQEMGRAWNSYRV